jgi:hypothetical protein
VLGGRKWRPFFETPSKCAQGGHAAQASPGVKVFGALTVMYDAIRYGVVALSKNRAAEPGLDK